MSRPIGRCTVLKRADLSVGATNADFEHPEFHLGRCRYSRLIVINELNLPTLGNDSDCFHATSDAAVRRRVSEGHLVPGRLPATLASCVRREWLAPGPPARLQVCA